MTGFTYKPMRYHYKATIRKKFLWMTRLVEKTGTTIQHFTDRVVLMAKINQWNSGHHSNVQFSWHYWESPEDMMFNLCAQPEPLPLFKVGWYGPDQNSHEFNRG